MIKAAVAGPCMTRPESRGLQRCRSRMVRVRGPARARCGEVAAQDFDQAAAGQAGDVRHLRERQREDGSTRFFQPPR